MPVPLDGTHVMPRGDGTDTEPVRRLDKQPPFDPGIAPRAGRRRTARRMFGQRVSDDLFPEPVGTRLHDQFHAEGLGRPTGLPATLLRIEHIQKKCARTVTRLAQK